MNDLKGKCVNVVLGIREGKGMDFLQSQSYIVANFNGRIMESDVCEQNENPCFNTELVWESEKRDVRKVRSTNKPLRVELCTTDQTQKKDVIGFTLLSLRSAPVITNCDLEIPYKWYKLLGVPNECKGNHPELYLSLTLRDHLINSELPRALPYILEDAENTNSKEIVPIRLIQDGFIQIGNDTIANEIFHLIVVIKSALNLDLLLPQDLVFGERNDKYYLTFEILGMTINSKPFYKDLHEKIILNDKIVLRMQSNFDILKDFFDQHAEVYVFFYCGTLKLASTKLNVANIVINITEDNYKNSHNSKLTMEETAYFASLMGLLKEGNDRKPCIEVASSLESFFEEIGAGEPPEAIKLSKNELNNECKIVHSPTILIEDQSTEVRKSLTSCQNCDNLSNLYLYSMVIELENLTWKSNPHSNNFSVIFYHPQAKTKLILNIDIDTSVPKKKMNLTNAKCKLFYVTTPDKLIQTIEAWFPKICFSYSNFVIDVPFEVKDVKIVNMKAEYSYSTQLQINGTILAEMNVAVFLEQYNNNIAPTDFDLLPHILDDMIALREIEDFNKWKINEKAKYTAQLKQLEKEFMANLKKEWTTRKNELEQKLLDNISRCRELNNQMKKASIALKVKNAFEEKQKEMRDKQNYIFDDEVYKNSLKYAHLNNKELIEKITEIKEENECLQEIIDEQQTEIEKFKKTSLTKEQTGNLLQELRILQEKYEESQKSKAYFKEQWKKSVREIHHLKTEGQNSIKNQLKTNFEELSHLSLDGFLKLKKANQNNKDNFDVDMDIDEDDAKIDQDIEDGKDKFYGFCTKKSCSEFNIILNNKN